MGCGSPICDRSKLKVIRQGRVTMESAVCQEPYKYSMFKKSKTTLGSSNAFGKRKGFIVKTMNMKFKRKLNKACIIYNVPCNIRTLCFYKFHNSYLLVIYYFEKKNTLMGRTQATLSQKKILKSFH